MNLHNITRNVLSTLILAANIILSLQLLSRLFLPANTTIRIPMPSFLRPTTSHPEPAAFVPYKPGPGPAIFAPYTPDIRWTPWVTPRPVPTTTSAAAAAMPLESVPAAVTGSLKDAKLAATSTPAPTAAACTVGAAERYTKTVDMTTRTDWEGVRFPMYLEDDVKHRVVGVNTCDESGKWRREVVSAGPVRVFGLW
ncbi:hypothetical protein GTA08_BOTSDO00703 [Botryosphaeria dothidea]|uniref:Uncharacterized protein n=1 Tax=Botryosphaeria dothidea TaxID=55169 RepID=A0A8H4NCQ8_9PEZI|nr:hypothetical protein GTA08_BOTSDO00703 [Botryosphaeria dothidea]